ncbi:MAG: OmpH family outer membrane protein [Armatimonadota bacterium]|nr:OmpH family outer membrane protein [Armatimonadota bacterium]MDR5697510.1 OmpH family outer membrane protein [Armatimonadota bacterium]
MDRKTKILMIAVGALVAVALAVWGLMVTGGTAIGQQLTIGYVDMQRALDSHPRKASSEEALNQFARARMTQAQQQARGRSQAEQTRLMQQAQQEILRRRTELLSALDKDIRAAVEKVAREAGVMIVLDRSVVLYGGTDLTEPVIRELKGN